IIMSATMEAEPAAVYLGNCPIVRAEGRTYPIEISYAPSPQNSLVDRVVASVRGILARPADQTGDVLAFLPGADEIRRAQRQLEEHHDDCLILPLHGSLPAEEQSRAL